MRGNAHCGVRELLHCFMQNSFQFLGADAPLLPPHQLFAATASMLPSTLPPLHPVDLKGYSVAVSSELGNYRYLHGAKLYVFRD
jgi:hypothetical protein